MIKSKRSLIRTYKRLYAAGQAVLDTYQPCRTKEGGPCHIKTFCCSGCRHLGKNGCRVKALWCKLWLCSNACHNRKAVDALCLLWDEAADLGLLHFRASMAKAIEKAVTNTK